MSNLANFVKNNWISIPVFVVSVVIAVYGIRKSSYERDLMFWCDDTKIETLLENNRISEAPIRIINKKDNSEITTDLFFAKFHIWNKGRRRIKNTHILESIKIAIADPGSKIIHFDIQKVSRNSIGFHLAPDIQENTINVLRRLLAEEGTYQRETVKVFQDLLNKQADAFEKLMRDLTAATEDEDKQKS